MRSTPGKVMETAGLVWARAVASQELLFPELEPLSLAVYSNDDHESIRTSEVEDLHHRCLMPLGRAEPPPGLLPQSAVDRYLHGHGGTVIFAP